MNALLLSSAVLVSFVAGFVALLAPCCVSVLLPAYFASTFRRRSQILGMTLVFAAGIAAVILPIALGASVLGGLINGHHTLVFSIGGAFMVIGGAIMVSGRRLALPMPAIGAPGSGGVGSVFALGSFSGVASACCAPVLAGVVAVSGAVSSFPAALAIGIAYVFGMVSPLCALALVWDRRDWGSSQLLTGRTITVRVHRWRRQLPVFALLSGVLLIGMGLLTIFLGVAGPSMATDGWQVRMSAWLTHAAVLVERAVSWLPGWLSALAIFGALIGVVVAAHRARHRHGRNSIPPTSAPAYENHSPSLEDSR